MLALSQAPALMSYQAVIRDANNELVANQVLGMHISILRGTLDGILVYEEIQSPITNVNGLVSLTIGSGESEYDFSKIDWSNGPYFIKTQTDITGGTSYNITSTVQLLSVPFALYAKSAENVFSGNYEGSPRGRCRSYQNKYTGRSLGGKF